MYNKKLPFLVLAVALLAAACVDGESTVLNQKPATVGIASTDNLITSLGSLASMLGNGVGLTQKVAEGLGSAASELGLENGRVSDVLSRLSGRATAVGSKAFGGVNEAAERVAELIKTPFQRDRLSAVRQRFESGRLNEDGYIESEDDAGYEDDQESSLEQAAERQALQRALSARRQAQRAKQQAVRTQQQAVEAAERQAERMQRRMARANSRAPDSPRRTRVSRMDTSHSSSKRKDRTTAKSMSYSQAKRAALKQVRRKSVAYME